MCKYLFSDDLRENKHTQKNIMAIGKKTLVQRERDVSLKSQNEEF